MVPVLSRATIWIFPVSSSETAVLKRMPFLAPIPFPTIMATGRRKAKCTGAADDEHGDSSCKSVAKRHVRQAARSMVVIMEMVITAGTKTPETRSAILAIGALVAAASLTIWMIWERVVSSPTRVAVALDESRTGLQWQQKSGRPAALSTGMLSPVRADSFTALVPSRTHAVNGDAFAGTYNEHIVLYAPGQWER